MIKVFPLSLSIGVLGYRIENDCSDWFLKYSIFRQYCLYCYCTWVRTALDAGGADVFLTVTSCGIWPKVKGFWVCCVGVGRSLCWWSTC